MLIAFELADDVFAGIPTKFGEAFEFVSADFYGGQVSVLVPRVELHCVVGVVANLDCDSIILRVAARRQLVDQEIT